MRLSAAIIITFIFTCVQVLCAPFLDVQTTNDISFTNTASILKVTIETQERLIEILWNFVSQQFSNHQTSSLVSRHLIHSGPNIHVAPRKTRESAIILPPFPTFPTLPPIPFIPILPPSPYLSSLPGPGAKK